MGVLNTSFPVQVGRLTSSGSEQHAGTAGLAHRAGDCEGRAAKAVPFEGVGAGVQEGTHARRRPA